MKCRVVGCDYTVMDDYPVDTDGMCMRCWGEATALEEMAKKEADNAVEND